MSERNTAMTIVPRRAATLFGVWMAVGLASVPAIAQQLDVCGCENMPSLGAFDNCDPATYPPGTTLSFSTVLIPLPEDGVLVFDSIRTRNCRSGTDFMAFRSNAANTPVTLLVKGTVQIDSGTGITVSGAAGGGGSANLSGRGGAPGPGGFRGGDGGHTNSRGTPIGGDGLGARGGAAGSVSPLNSGVHGQYFGASTGLPLSGGSGGGGGSETGAGGSCSGGGGGGGSGSIVIAANSHIAVNNGLIFANGGAQGNPGNGGCSAFGGSGSGGLIRLVSPRVLGGGQIQALGGNNRGNNGVIRIESFNDTFGTDSSPPALRSRVISPLTNPVASTIAITEIDGQPVPEPPRGNVGLIDLLIDAPGLVTMRVDTQGVPGGTTVEVAVKPDVGGGTQRSEVTLDPNDCDAAGACFTFATFNLDEGAYYAEAAATYRTP